LVICVPAPLTEASEPDAHLIVATRNAVAGGWEQIVKV